MLQSGHDHDAIMLTATLIGLALAASIYIFIAWIERSQKRKSRPEKSASLPHQKKSRRRQKGAR